MHISCLGFNSQWFHCGSSLCKFSKESLSFSFCNLDEYICNVYLAVSLWKTIRKDVSITFYHQFIRSDVVSSYFSIFSSCTNHSMKTALSWQENPIEWGMRKFFSLIRPTFWYLGGIKFLSAMLSSPFSFWFFCV